MTKDTGGAAFPNIALNMQEGEKWRWQNGMTLRQYAAIKLRVPDSGLDWLDDMIREGRRMDYAGQALANPRTFPTEWSATDDIADWADSLADAMIAERNK